jgi:MerR family copper efflux transcriptional regulator
VAPTPGLRIAEVARRSGFSPATLRYYEDIGLLPATSRTRGGYRAYDERTLERLAFIARAKQLGCSLEEIADLTMA